MQDSRIAIIGCGNMGGNLIGGLIASGFPEKSISVADHNPAQLRAKASSYNVTISADNRQIVKDADIVVLAMKPQALKDALQGIKPELAKQKPLLISIAAGIKLSHLTDWAGEDMAIVRAMPNIATVLQAGATALIANQHTHAQHRELAERVMSSVGVVLWLDDETLMDVVTALSGSGPAYYFLVMEIMEKAAISLGLAPQHARLLTLQTAFGAAKMSLHSQHSPALLRQQVTSEKGTTEQALKVLTEGGIEQLFADAINSAHKRSIELSDSIEQR